MGTGLQRGVSLLLLGLALVGCARGQPRDQRPLVIIPDMEVQRKFRAQGHTPFFEDGRMMRTPPRGTVARGTLREDTALYEGRVYPNARDTVLVARNPREITEQLLRRGQKQFNVFCSPCHDRTGAGKGIVAGYGLVPPPTFHQDRLRDLPDGHFFEVITNGIRNMPGYGAQVPVEDRWAIVAYLRALQRSQYATLADVPLDERNQLR